MSETTNPRDPWCECGSGFRRRLCHGRRRSIPPHIVDSIRRRQEADKRHRELHGEIREVVHADFQNHKFVAVGSRMAWGKWKTFPDFLTTNIKAVLGSDGWGNRELEKPLGERHPILKWYDALCGLQERVIAQAGPGEGRIFDSPMDGPSRAYMLLAYDLYILEDNGALWDDVVRRLRDKDQFQGARYEVMVAATMLRAGFDLQPEDETDGARKHPEFLAVDRRAGHVLAVEAKSKHRIGLLDFDPPDHAVAEDEEAFKLRVRGLIRNALKKAAEHPLIIFVEANIPPDVARRAGDWVPQALKEIEAAELGERRTGADGSFAALILTTSADYFAEPGTGGHRGEVFLHVQSTASKRPLPDPALIDRIARALSQYGNFPQDFPEA